MESLPWGGIKGKAQSERPKRDPRHSDKSAESSGQPSGAGHSYQMGLKRRARLNGQVKIVSGIGANLSDLLGLVVLCPSQRAELMGRIQRATVVMERGEAQ